MRIRRSAARLLSSAYSAPAAPSPDAVAPSELLTTPLPPPPLYMEPCSAPESSAVCGFASPEPANREPCGLNRSPWDLIAELSLSDPQVEDDLVGKYFVSVTCRASWLFTASMPVASVKKEKQAVGAGTVDGESTTSQPRPRQEVQKKVPKFAVSKEKESEPKKAKVKKEEDQEVKQPSYKCKKNDGKRWQCRRPVRRPNSLCDYHFYQQRAYLNPEFAALVAAEAEAVAEMEVPQPAPASKPATSSKPRKKKKAGHDFGATEGFYYYAGFGRPCRSKRHCRSSSSMNEYEKEGEELAEDCFPTNEQAQVAADDTTQQATGRDDKSSCEVILRIAGVDEESSDDHYELGNSGRGMNGNGEHRAGNFDGSKMNKGWKRRRKPVKARSLKSLM